MGAVQGDDAACSRTCIASATARKSDVRTHAHRRPTFEASYTSLPETTTQRLWSLAVVDTLLVCRRMRRNSGKIAAAGSETGTVSHHSRSLVIPALDHGPKLSGSFQESAKKPPRRPAQPFADRPTGPRQRKGTNHEPDFRYRRAQPWPSG